MDESVSYLKSKKTQLFLSGLLGIFTFGFAGPYLISAKSDELVMAGFVLVVLVVFVIWQLLKPKMKGNNK